MNERIDAIIKETGIKRVDFAKRLNLSPPYISELCSGKTKPSDRTISDICREFNVSENWLRTGSGEMFIQLSRSQEVAEFTSKILKGDNDNFKRRFIAVLAQLEEPEWELIEKMAKKLSAVDMKKD